MPINIDFPEDIKLLAQKFKDKKERAEAKIILKKAEKDAEESANRELRLKEGLVYAKKIFAWLTAFKDSEIGRELMAEGHPPTAYGLVIIFNEKLDGITWTGLAVSANGVTVIKAFGRMGPDCHVVNNPEQLAVAVHTKVLEMAEKNISTGRVWECIKSLFNTQR